MSNHVLRDVVEIVCNWLWFIILAADFFINYIFFDSKKAKQATIVCSFCLISLFLLLGSSDNFKSESRVENMLGVIVAYIAFSVCLFRHVRDENTNQ